MKTRYQIGWVVLYILCWVGSATADEGGAGKVDVLAMKAVPEGKYGVTLELKQLDGVPARVTLECRGAELEGMDDRLGAMRGRIQPIGNGVFMVQLRGKGYVATQFWVFQPDGSAEIKEIPERGEKQRAVQQ